MSRTPWTWYLVAMLAATGLFVLLPAYSPASTAIHLAVHASVIGALAWGLRRYRPVPRAPWLVLLAGYGLLLVANAARYGTAEPATPLAADSVSGGLYLVAYLAIAIGLLLLVRARGALRDLRSLADATIVVAGIATVWFEFSIAPILERPGMAPFERLVVVTYPVPGFLFLVFLLWLVFSKGNRGAALPLLIGGIVAQTAADALLGLSDLGLVSTGNAEMPLWLLSFALVGAAALHPSLPLIGAKSDQPSWFPAGRRVYLLALVTLLVPLSLLRESIRAGSGGGVVFAVAMAGLVLLVYGRLQGLFVDVDTYTRTQAELRASEDRYRTLAADLDARVAARTAETEAANEQLRTRGRELTASRALLDDVVATVPGIIFRGRLPGGELEYISPSAERFLGWTAAESLGTPGYWAELIHPDDRAAFWARSQSAREEGPDSVTLEYRARHKDGTYRWVLSTTRYVRDETGQPSAFVGSAIDITDRKAAEADLQVAHAELVERERQLRETHVYLENLVSSVSVVLFRGHGPGFTTEYVSPGVEQMLGFTPEDVLTTSGFWVGRIHPDDQARVAAAVREVIEGRLPVHTVEFRMIHRDGRERWIHSVVQYEYDADGAWHFTGTVTDITERRRVEDELRRAKEEAERANRAKSEFLSSASHELRTPLNSVLGFAQLLERSKLSPDDHDSVAQILRAGRTLLAMIDSVLELARVESGRLTLSIEPVSVEELIHETVDLVRPMAAERGSRLVTPADVERPPWVLADRRRIKQVILNLLTNAVAYSRDDGSVTIAYHVAAGDRLRLSVSDTGPGIPAERQATLFTIFDRRIGSDHTRAGLGVGLALSARLIEAMDGSISVESEVGAGSTFSIELPLAAEPAAGSGKQSEPGPGAPARATVVYVEDNLANLKLVERILDVRPGTRVLAAMQGSLGCDLAQQHHPDLVLLDLHLPDMPGEEVLRLLQDDPATRDIPVIVMSSALGNGSGQRLLDLGAEAYLAKPIDVAAFLAAVDRILRGGVTHA